MLPGAAPPKPIPLKERSALVFVERARLDVKDGAFVAIDADGNRTHIPIGGVACLMLEPGARISHAAVALAGRVGTLIVWIGEAGVRLYAAGQPGGARSDKLMWQASLAMDPQAQLRVVREMYRIRFDELAPQRRSIEQLRGIEGARVWRMYDLLAKQYGVNWKRRRYNPKQWNASDLPLIVACQLPQPVHMDWQRPQFLRQDTRQRLVFFTLANLYLLYMTLPTFGRQRLLYRRHFALLGLYRMDKLICRLSAQSGFLAEIAFGQHGY